MPGKEVRMGSALIQILVLLAIAVFLLLRFRSVLGTRKGFEKPPAKESESKRVDRGSFFYHVFDKRHFWVSRDRNSR